MADDPTRLLDDAGGALLRALLSAARTEQPGDAALRSTHAAVSAAAAAVSAHAAAQGAAAKGAATSTTLIVVKWLGIGAIVGVVFMSAVYGVTGALAPALHPGTAAPRAHDK